MIILIHCDLLLRKLVKQILRCICKRGFSIMVMHMTFNHQDIGSNPINPKGRIVIGKTRYLLNIVCKHLSVQITLLP